MSIGCARLAAARRSPQSVPPFGTSSIDQPVAVDLRDAAGDDVVVAHEARDERRRGPLEHFARGRRLLDPAVVHHDDEVGERHRLFLAVGDVDEGDAEPRLQLLELGAHADLEEGIERRQRLVEQQRSRDR